MSDRCTKEQAVVTAERAIRASWERGESMQDDSSDDLVWLAHLLGHSKREPGLLEMAAERIAMIAAALHRVRRGLTR
jgi:hypothetical protein